MKVKEKDECSYSFSNAIRTLVMGYRNTIDVLNIRIHIQDQTESRRSGANLEKGGL